MTLDLADAIAAISGAEWVTGSVLRLPLPSPTLPPATTTNHYLVGDQSSLLVDPATPHRGSQHRLKAVFSAWQTHIAPIHGVLLTHHHRDHIAAARLLATHLGVPVMAHAATAALLSGRVKIDRLIEDGEVVAQDHGGPWRALHTPGHAPGHLVLAGPDGGMIVGDMVAGQGSILIDPSDGDMGAYLASLRRLQAAGPSWLAPAHGPVLREAQATLSHYINHRLAREAQIFAALSTEEQPEDALLPHAYGDVPRTLWPLALRALRAHLVYLAVQRRAVETRPRRWCRVAAEVR